MSSAYNRYNPEYNEKEAHIVYASDDGFAEILGVSLVSLYENNKQFENIFVYILDSGIRPENIHKLNSIAEQFHRPALQYIKAIDITEKLSIQVNLDRGSTSQYARLFIADLLDVSLNRILYLDCDIIINQSIEELWTTDLNGNIIAALKDAFSADYRKIFDLEPDDVMFNSGVMLIDLEKWRSEQIEKKLLDFIRSRNGHIQQGDQGALNAVLSRQTYCIAPKFNAITIFFDFSYEEMLVYREPVDFYSKAEVDEAVRNPVLIHFTTSFLSKRPWYDGCQHKFLSSWTKYKALSPWRDSKNRTAKKESFFKAMYIRLAGIMPRKMMIRISGMLHAHGRPLLYRKKS